MDLILQVISWLQAHSGWIAIGFAFLFHLSEALAAIPSIQANGVFQLVFNFLKSKQP